MQSRFASSLARWTTPLLVLALGATAGPVTLAQTSQTQGAKQTQQNAPAGQKATSPQETERQGTTRQAPSGTSGQSGEGQTPGIQANPTREIRQGAPAIEGTLQSPPGQPLGAGTVDQARFVEEAWQNSKTAVMLGTMAPRRNVSEPVRQLAAMLVKDHNPMMNGLQQLATVQRFALPAEVDPAQQKLMDRIGGLTGREFEMAFLDQMIMQLTQNATLYEQAVRSPLDAQLKQFAASHLPVLQQELQRMRDVRARIMEPAATRPGA